MQISIFALIMVFIIVKRQGPWAESILNKNKAISPETLMFGDSEQIRSKIYQWERLAIKIYIFVGIMVKENFKERF